MLNVSVPPLASFAVGVNEYSVPAVAVVGGVPEIVGGVFDDATVIENAGNGVDALPSLTLMTMLLYVRTCVAPGVPCNAPVVTLNVAHVGRLAIANVNALPSGSLAVGVNVYAVPCVAVVAGAPEIVGGRLPVGARTVIANAGSDAVAVPSLTEITMLPKSPSCPSGGVPLKPPVVVSNAAQLGRPVIANVSTLPSGSLAVGTNAYAVPASTLVIGAPEMTGARFTGGGVTAMRERRQRHGYRSVADRDRDVGERADVGRERRALQAPRRRVESRPRRSIADRERERLAVGVASR